MYFYTAECSAVFIFQTSKRLGDRRDFALVYLTVVGTFFGLVLLGFFITLTCDAGTTTDF